MAIYFNGQYVEQPSTVVMVNDSAMLQPSLNGSGVLVLIAQATKGKPKSAIVCSSFADAQTKVGGGQLLQAMQRAFRPQGGGNAPTTVIGIRPEVATGSTGKLTDASAATIIDLTAGDYGTWTNQTKYSVTAGSTSGYKVSVGNDFDGNPVTMQDNVYRDLFSIYYTGAGTSPTITVTPTTITLAATGGTPASLSVDLTTYTTLSAVINYINSQSGGFTATQLFTNPNYVMAGQTDYYASLAVGTTAVTATKIHAHDQALVDWFNGGAQPYITAARHAGATTSGVKATTNYVYLSGGTSPAASTSDWQDCYTYLQNQQADFVVPVTSTAAVWAMNDAHCQLMAENGSPRNGAVGDAKGSNLAAQLTNAQSLNSSRTMLVWPGIIDTDVNGNPKTTLDPFFAAAQIGGLLMGTPTQDALTGQLLSGQDLEYVPTSPDITEGLQGGICLLTKTFQGNIEVSRSQTTWMQTTSFIKREISTRRITDAVVSQLQIALNKIVRGKGGAPGKLADAVAQCNAICKILADDGWLVGDSKNPAYLGFSATLNGDVLSVTGQFSPAVPINYIPVTLNAVPYSGQVA